MGMVNANFLPATTGLSLGTQNQQWLVNGFPALVQQTITVPFSSTPAFVSTAPSAVFVITLTANVTSSTFSGLPGIFVFQIKQDVSGGRTFTWPTSFQQPTVIGSAANQVTTQIFYFDGANAWALGPGIIVP